MRLLQFRKDLSQPMKNAGPRSGTWLSEPTSFPGWQAKNHWRRGIVVVVNSVDERVALKEDVRAQNTHARCLVCACAWSMGDFDQVAISKWPCHKIAAGIFDEHFWVGIADVMYRELHKPVCAQRSTRRRRPARGAFT